MEDIHAKKRRHRVIQQLNEKAPYKQQSLKDLRLKLSHYCQTFIDYFSNFFGLRVNQQKKPLSKKPTSIKKNTLKKKIQNQVDIFSSLALLTREERMDKGIRHFHDALQQRSCRHDIDGKHKKKIRMIWIFMNSKLWSNILWCFALGYSLLTFLEPPNRFASHQDDSQFNLCYKLETTILSFFLVDIFLSTYLTLNFIKNWSFRNLWEKEQKLIWKVICQIILLSDFINSVTSYPGPSFRFSRFVRPLMLISYSQDLRRNIKGISGCLKNLLVLVFFQLAVIGLYSFIGINIMSEVNSSIPQLDELLVDYGDFFKLFNLLILLSALDFYPDILVPTVKVNYLYALYFIPFIFLFMFLLLPIPLAIIYEGYRSVRLSILIADRLKQREALLACFLSFDIDNQGCVTQATFKEFLNLAYKNQLTEKQIQEFYLLLDNNDSGQISIEEFFNLIQVIDENKKFTPVVYPPLKKWVEFREFVNTKFKLFQILEGNSYQIFMFLVTIVNCTLIIVSLFLDDSYVTFNNVDSTFDNVFFSIYLLEFILKLIGYGIVEYFSDNWNLFDFFLILFQILFDYILLNILSKNFIKSFKANRFLRLTKMQKVFRLFRAFRTVKVVNFLMVGIEIFGKVKDLFVKIMICIPVVLKQITTIWIVFYIYGIICVEVLSNIGSPYNYSPYQPVDCSDLDRKDGVINNFVSWGSCNYADFNTLWGSLFLLIQVFIGNGSPILFDISHKIGSAVFPSIFFASFVFISVFLLTLLSGLIWEVFTIVQDYWREQNELEQKQIDREERYQRSKKNKAYTRTNGATQENFNRKNTQRFSDQTLNDNKVEKMKNYNFTLDLLADDNKVQIEFSEIDKFILYDQKPYIQKNKDYKVSISLINENLDDSAYIKPFKYQESNQDFINSSISEEKSSIQFNDGIADKLKDKSAIYLYQNPNQDLRKQSDKTASSSVQHEKQLRLQQRIFFPHDLLEDFLHTIFKSLPEYSRKHRRKQRDLEGVFSGEEIINSFYITQVKASLKELEEITKQEHIKDVHFDNHRFLIENAILKGANQKNIRKQELNHFFQLFGHQFEKLREMKITSLLSIQSRLMFHLHNSLKFQELDIKFFLQVFLSTETLITNSLLPGSSFCKFVIGDEDGAFSYLNFDQDKFQINPLQSKAFYYLSQFSRQQSYGYENLDDQIRIAYDFYNLNHLDSKFIQITKDIRQFLTQTRVQIKIFLNYKQRLGISISQRFSSRNLKSSKFYCIIGTYQLRYSIENQLNELNKQFMEKYPEINIPQVKYLQIWFFLEKENLQCHQIFKDIHNGQVDSNDHNRPVYDQKQFFQNISFNLMEEKQEEEEEKEEEMEYFKDEDQYQFLPFPYIIELMKDLLNLVAIHEQNLFLQFSQTLHLRRQQQFLLDLQYYSKELIP